MPYFRNAFGGLLIAFMLLMSSTMGTVVLVTPVLPVIFLSPKLSRRMTDFLIELWFLLAVALYEMLMGVKIVVKGHPSKRGTSTLMLCNHPTRLDWLFFLSYLCRFSSVSEYRISLKAPLKKIPGAGWAMQCAGFLFLERKWDIDKVHISNGMNYFSKVESKPQFLLFPEGTDLCPGSLSRSNKFAEKQGYPHYKYCLHPRTAGFVHFVKEMKKGKILDSILDITVAYPKTKIQSELETLKGNYPEEIHVFIKDYPISTLPNTDSELEEWCRQLWYEKEKRLEHFYANKSFDSFDQDKDVANGLVKHWDPMTEDDVEKKLHRVVAFWVVFLSTTFTCLFLFPMFRIFCTIGCATYIIIMIRHGGVDKVIYKAVRHYE